MEMDVRVILAALAALTIIEVVALLKGINGALMLTVFALIGGLGGYKVKNFNIFDKSVKIKTNGKKEVKF